MLIQISKMYLLFCWLATSIVFASCQSPLNDDADFNPYESNNNKKPLRSLPYTACVIVDGPHGRFKCSGAIVHEKWVLTVSSCLRYTPDVDVFVYAYDPNCNGTNIKVLRVENFQRDAHKAPGNGSIVRENDFTLLRLIASIQTLAANASVNPITISTNETGLFPGRYCTLSGYENALNERRFPIIAGNKCKKYVPAIQNGMICAGFVMQDRHVCFEVGGPFVCAGKLHGFAVQRPGNGVCGTKRDVGPEIIVLIRTEILEWIQRTIEKDPTPESSEEFDYIE